MRQFSIQTEGEARIKVKDGIFDIYKNTQGRYLWRVEVGYNIVQSDADGFSNFSQAIADAVMALLRLGVSLDTELRQQRGLEE